MKKSILIALFASLCALPYARAWAEAESKESAKEEKAESIEQKQHEEREAMEGYQKKAAKFGKDSPQAKKAWKHVLAEYKEHGDTPPTAGTEPMTSSATTRTSL